MSNYRKVVRGLIFQSGESGLACLKNHSFMKLCRLRIVGLLSVVIVGHTGDDDHGECGHHGGLGTVFRGLNYENGCK